MDIMIALVLFVAVAALFAWKKGFFKNSDSKPSAPIRSNPPTNSAELQMSYPSDVELRAFIKRTGFSTAVKLDGESINLGFGPAVEFTTQINGSVRR